MTDDAKSKTGWAAAALTGAAVDAGLASVNLPQVAGPLVAGAQAIVALGQGVFNRNAEEAGAECERALEETSGAQVAIERLRGDVDELQRRLTLAFRLTMEAGRHPDRELRAALGRFAARVLLEHLESVNAFEAAEALARMTALDFAVLQALRGGGTHDVYMAVRDQFPGLDHDRTVRAVERLRGMGLIDRTTRLGGEPSPLGHELLRVTLGPSGEA